jgi:hypothetical protein
VRRDGLEDLVGKPPVDDPDERHNRGGKISPSRRAPYAAEEEVFGAVGNA